MDNLLPPDRVWIITDWFPRAAKSGLQAIAGFLPHHPTCRIIMEQPLIDICHYFNIQMRWFRTESEGMTWLRAQDKIFSE